MISRLPSSLVIVAKTETSSRTDSSTATLNSKLSSSPSSFGENSDVMVRGVDTSTLPSTMMLRSRHWRLPARSVACRNRRKSPFLFTSSVSLPRKPCSTFSSLFCRLPKNRSFLVGESAGAYCISITSLSLNGPSGSSALRSPIGSSISTSISTTLSKPPLDFARGIPQTS